MKSILENGRKEEYKNIEKAKIIKTKPEFAIIGDDDNQRAHGKRIKEKGSTFVDIQNNIHHFGYKPTNSQAAQILVLIQMKNEININTKQINKSRIRKLESYKKFLIINILYQ